MDKIKISKFLSLVLRHKPEEVDLTLDENGWANTQDVMEKCKIDFETLKELVATNDKKRFAFNEDLSKIRASQGHSIKIDLGYVPQIPPSILYHGTGAKSVESILKTGIEKRSRQHVHLSKDFVTAVKVGQRHGRPVIFKVDSEKMQEDGISFFLSDNGVWLTEYVDPKYIKMVGKKS